MAQVDKKVTDFFVSKKRNPEAHVLKRQKIRDFDESLGKPCNSEHSSPTKLSKADGILQSKKKERSSKGRPTTDKVSKTAARIGGKQLTLADSIKCRSVPSESNPTNAVSQEVKAPAKESFDFKLDANVPSDCDIVVRSYDTNCSPRSTPTKRSSKEKSTAAKRKRTTEPNDKTSEPLTLVATPTARKKLDMPTSEPSVVPKSSASTGKQNMTSKASTQVQKSSKRSKSSDIKALRESLKNKIEEMKKTSRGPPTSSESTAVTPISFIIPAYEKYKDLAVKIPRTLTLPHKYKLLDDMFKGTDTVISIMYNRQERCTFDKLKQAVQRMIRKNFEPRHLGQIKSVYPESYEVRQETGLVESGARSTKYQMTVEPVLESAGKDAEVTKRKDGRPVMSSSEVGRRKESFRGRLFDLVRSHHQKFLEKLKPPVKVDPQKVTRWHPKFLASDIPEVEPAALPESPEPDKELITARDVLTKARGKVPSKVEMALQKVAEATESLNNLKNLKKTAVENKLNVEKATADSKAVPTASNSTSGISASLLERIRAKESVKAQAAMLRDEATDVEMDILGRLPEMIQILRSHFITEKKAALTEDSLIVKLCDSYKSSISQSSVEKHIDYMLKSLPDWISRVSVSTGKYLKINRQTELSLLNNKLKQLLKQKQYHIPGE